MPNAPSPFPPVPRPRAAMVTYPDALGSQESTCASSKGSHSVGYSRVTICAQTATSRAPCFTHPGMVISWLSAKLPKWGWHFVYDHVYDHGAGAALPGYPPGWRQLPESSSPACDSWDLSSDQPGCFELEFSKLACQTSADPNNTSYWGTDREQWFSP